MGSFSRDPSMLHEGVVMRMLYELFLFYIYWFLSNTKLNMITRKSYTNSVDCASEFYGQADIVFERES